MPDAVSDQSRPVSELRKLARNVVGFALVPVFVVPSISIVLAAAWVCRVYELVGWQLVLAIGASVPIAGLMFVFTIPAVLASDAWLTKLFGVAISERKPAVLSSTEISRLSLLPRSVRAVSIAVGAPVALIVPLGVAYAGAVALGLTAGDLRGQFWPLMVVVLLVFVAFLWFEPKVVRALDHWIAGWNALRQSHRKAFGRRPWWAHCLFSVGYVVGTFGLPLLLAFLLIWTGVHPSLVGVPILLSFAIAAVANLYFLDLLAIWSIQRFGRAR